MRLYYDTLQNHHVDKPEESKLTNFKVTYVSYACI